MRPDNPMGFQFGFTKEDGSKTIRNDLSGWAYIQTDSPLLMTMIWLHAVMPRVFRGRSVFSPYLVRGEGNGRNLGFSVGSRTHRVLPAIRRSRGRKHHARHGVGPRDLVWSHPCADGGNPSNPHW